MAEPFKNQINHELITQMGRILHGTWNQFDVDGFIALASQDLDTFELKERCFRIVEALEIYLPKDYVKAAGVLERSLHPEVEQTGFKNTELDSSGIQGWAIMAVQEYVGRNGLEHLGISLHLLKNMTKRLTSEFGIRYFIEAYQLETLKTMQVWARDPSEHVRRLVSEGTRPRLPWGMQLKRFISDPSPIIPLLEVLKDDPSEYVRRSVANNLNDIAKDHPNVVCMVAKSWMVDADMNRVRLIKHALRTLVKQGNGEALAILGYGPAKLSEVKFSIERKLLVLGDYLNFTASLHSSSKESQSMLVDYAVHYQKANGSMKPKVFKWKQFVVEPGQTITIRKKHLMQSVSVRKLYEGDHRIELLVNGKSFGTCDFVLAAD